MSDWLVTPARRPLAGTVHVPGDKSIGHRALLLAALCDGPTPIHGLSSGDDNRRTVLALEAMGVRIDHLAPGEALVNGVGPRGLVTPAAALDCGNSGTTMRLLAGLLAGQAFASTLVGDASLSCRPMRRIVAPLTRMGARIAGQPGRRAGEVYPPLTVEGGRLVGIAHTSEAASAQVKSAIILAALFARGPTEVREPTPSRDHTERMLAYLGAPVTVPSAGVVRVDPERWNGRFVARRLTIPGDPSSAAFVIAAALLAGGEPTIVTGVGTNPTRTGFLDVLAAMDAPVEQRGGRVESGEPVADLIVPQRPERLRAAEIAGSLTVRALDELPVLAVVAARAAGQTVVRDAAELRVKESDRIAATVAMLAGFGIRAEARPDGFVVDGQPDRPLRGADVASQGDHRIAMAAAIAALVADDETRVRDVESVGTSFPGFTEVLTALGAEIRSV